MLDLVAIQAANEAKQVLVSQLARIERREWPGLVSAFVCSLGAHQTPDPAAVLTLIVDLVTQVSRLPGGRLLPKPAEFVPSIKNRDYLSSSHKEEMLEGLATDLRRWLSQAEPASRAAEVSAFIDAHLSERLTLESLAKTFCSSPRCLSQLYKKHSGLTVHTYIARQRIRHAGELVRRGEKVEVAMLEVGYHNKTHFYRAFERYAGSKPGAYAQRSDD